MDREAKWPAPLACQALDEAATDATLRPMSAEQLEQRQGSFIHSATGDLTKATVWPLETRYPLVPKSMRSVLRARWRPFCPILGKYAHECTT